eukprot:g1956.t1
MFWSVYGDLSNHLLSVFLGAGAALTMTYLLPLWAISGEKSKRCLGKTCVSPLQTIEIHLLKSNDVRHGSIELLGQRKDTLTGPETCSVGHRSLFSEDSKVGVWSCTTGKFHVPTRTTTETCYILEGSATLQTENSKQCITVRAGDVFVLPIGWAGTWQIEEDLRKIYVISPARAAK